MKARGITIFTTTKGDQANVLRLEEYLHKSSFCGEFLVICANQAPGLTGKFKRKFTSVINAPGISINEAFHYAGRKAKNDLIQFVGDDDFPIIENIDKVEKDLTNKKLTEKMICVAGNSCWINYNIFKGKDVKANLANFIKLMLLHKLGIRIKKNEGSISDKIINTHDNYQVYQFGLFTKSSWQNIFNKEYGEIKDAHMQEIASSFITAAAIKIIETDRYMYLRGTGHLRPNTNKDEAEERNKFDYQEGERELRKYIEKTTENRQISEKLINACLSYRLLSGKQLKRYKQDNNDIEKTKKDIYERVKDLATDEGLLDSICTIISLKVVDSADRGVSE